MMHETIKLEHGSGGYLANQLVADIIYPAFQSEAYPELTDAAGFGTDAEWCMTTDSFVVDPPFFPGSDIGRLSVFGTCNDLAVSGAEPRFISCAFILEEGFPMADFRRVLTSIASACKEVGVQVITGDTKVVPRGTGDGIYINTCGIGRRQLASTPSRREIHPGDRLILSGPVGSHGLAVLAAREDLQFKGDLVSDCGNLFPLCRELYDYPDQLRLMRDVTRGGLATICNEFVAGTEFGILLDEASIPIRPEVATIGEILGMDPLEIANEGVFCAVTAPAPADEICRRLGRHALGTEARIIGSVVRDYPGRVMLCTTAGIPRRLVMPRGLLLPRIC